jgi:hypothetical protein
VVPLSQIATDPNHATNRAKRTYNASKLGLGPAVSAEALAPAINGVRGEFYAEAGTQLPYRKETSGSRLRAATRRGP